MNNDIGFNFSDTPKADIYPMPVFCTLFVSDVQKAADWYVRALGFSVLFEIQDPVAKKATFVHLRRAKYQDILLKPRPVAAASEHIISEQTKNHAGIEVTFQAWSDIDALAAHAKANGALLVVEPHDTAWHTRDVTFQDLDGYRINFTYPNQELLQKIKTMDTSLASPQGWENK